VRSIDRERESDRGVEYLSSGVDREQYILRGRVTFKAETLL